MRPILLKTGLVIFACLLCVGPRLLAATQKPSPCDEEALPKAVTELLKKQFPQWRPKQVSDIDAENRQLWVDGPNGEGCPGIVKGHFRTAKSLSYAFLLVPRANPDGGHKIIIVSKQDKKDAYISTLLDHSEEQTYSGLVISKADPGKYKDWEEKKSIQIQTDVLYVEWIGKGAKLYYRSAGRYHELQVSD